ncbi:MAG TPA: superoxide dismutase family protein [Vicinamibacterales bacterium]
MRYLQLGLGAALVAGVAMMGQVAAQQSGAAKPGDHAGHASHQAGGAKSAVAKLSPTANNTARGEVTFTQEGEGVRVSGSFSGLTFGEHGFHVHEKGDCSAPDASSAGGHFNPTSQQHGAREADQRHVGDLGNLKVDPYGLARVDFVDKHLSLSGPNSIVGKAVIVHEKADDFKTQPTGDAGGRLACGVIEAK